MKKIKDSDDVSKSSPAIDNLSVSFPCPHLSIESSTHRNMIADYLKRFGVK